MTKVFKARKCDVDDFTGENNKNDFLKKYKGFGAICGDNLDQNIYGNANNFPQSSLDFEIVRCTNENREVGDPYCASSTEIDNYYDGMTILPFHTIERINFQDTQNQKPTFLTNNLIPASFVDKNFLITDSIDLRMNKIESIDTVFSFGCQNPSEYTFYDSG